MLQNFARASNNGREGGIPLAQLPAMPWAASPPWASAWASARAAAQASAWAAAPALRLWPPGAGGIPLAQLPAKLAAVAVKARLPCVYVYRGYGKKHTQSYSKRTPNIQQ